MNKFILLLAAISLCACERKQNLPLISATSLTPVQTLPAPDSSSILFVGAGQSQMSKETNLKDVFHNSVNVAVGGSPLSSWQRLGPYYPRIIDVCKNRSPQCVLLFWQGEAETTDAALAATWGSQFLIMVDSLRQDLGYDIKVVYVQIGQVTDSNDPTMPRNYASYFPYWQTVKDQQNAVNHTRPNLEMVASEDMIPDSGDGIHYALWQYHVIAGRMLTAWQGMGI